MVVCFQGQNQNVDRATNTFAFGNQIPSAFTSLCVQCTHAVHHIEERAENVEVMKSFAPNCKSPCIIMLFLVIVKYNFIYSFHRIWCMPKNWRNKTSMSCLIEAPKSVESHALELLLLFAKWKQQNSAAALVFLLIFWLGFSSEKILFWKQSSSITSRQFE